MIIYSKEYNKTIKSAGTNNMKNKYLKILPIPQYSYSCVTTAIAALDRYYADIVGFFPILLHKRFLGSGFISLRQMAKAIGSKQGELLEIRMVNTLLNHLGYRNEMIEIKNLEHMKEIIHKSREQGHPLITFFAAELKLGITFGIPTKFNGDNTHAGVIFDLDTKTNQVSLMHWGRYDKVPLENLFSSSQSLPEKQNKEVYISIKKDNPKLKYTLVYEEKKLQSSADPSLFKHTIEPREMTGFRNRLIRVTEFPKLELMRVFRNKFFSETINLDYISKKLSEFLKLNQDSVVKKINSNYKLKMNTSIKEFMQTNDLELLKNSVKKAHFEYLRKIKPLKMTEDERQSIINYLNRVKFEILGRFSGQYHKILSEQKSPSVSSNLFILEELEFVEKPVQKFTLSFHIMSGTVNDELNPTYRVLNTKKFTEKLSFRAGNYQQKIIFHLSGKVANDNPKLKKLLPIIVKNFKFLTVEFHDKSGKSVIDSMMSKIESEKSSEITSEIESDNELNAINEYYEKFLKAFSQNSTTLIVDTTSNTTPSLSTGGSK